MLRRLLYVGLYKGKDDQGEYVQLASDIVDINRLKGTDYLDQVRDWLRTSMPSDAAAVTLGRDPTDTADMDQQHAWRIRAQEDAAALGGLRNPSMSIKRLPGAAATGEKLRNWIDTAINPRYDELKEAMNTLGKESMPSVFADTAVAARRRMASECGVELKPPEELQGELLHRISQELGDPDTEVVRWVREGSTPLGIEKPIVPCGVFPLAEPKTVSDEADAWAQDWNYLSYEEH